MEFDSAKEELNYTLFTLYLYLVYTLYLIHIFHQRYENTAMICLKPDPNLVLLFQKNLKTHLTLLKIDEILIMSIINFFRRIIPICPFLPCFHFDRF